MRHAKDLLTLFLSRLHIAVTMQKPSPQSLLALCLLNKKKGHNVPGFFSHLEEAYLCFSELKYVCVFWNMNLFLPRLQVLTTCMGFFPCNFYYSNNGSD